jgi:hypothetical protein
VKPREDEYFVEGWTVFDDEPARAVAIFAHLRVRAGYKLMGYRYECHGNGNGFVYAVKADAAVARPEECRRLKGHFLEPPIPEGRLEDLMEAIEGEETALSYLEASILGRELQELGAQWHGCDWSTHEVVDRDLTREPPPDQGDWNTRPWEWTWKTARPEEWRPAVAVAVEAVRVTFYTYSRLGVEMVYRHTDEYRRGERKARRTQKSLAKGVMGYKF